MMTSEGRGSVVLQIGLTVEQFEILIRKGIILGYMRVEPKRVWTVAEKKDCVRWTITRLADRFLQRDQEYKDE